MHVMRDREAKSGSGDGAPVAATIEPFEDSGGILVGDAES
jgi:hypothetical protein